jgi:hypothetical protein
VETKTEVLVDRSFDGQNSLHGREWLDALGGKKLSGSITNGSLHIEIVREDGKGGELWVCTWK